MSPQQTEKPQPSEFDYNLRLYRNGDDKEVRALYLNAMIWQSHSPLRPFLRLFATSTIAKVLYLISIFGAVIWAYLPALGLAIFLTGGGAALLLFGFAYRKLLSLMRRNVRRDLMNVAEYYMLVPDVEVYGDLKTSGPRGFWVVEATHRVTGKKELAGCVGLGILQKDGNSEGELRRMAVSNRHTRRGVAAMVIKAAVGHAKAHDISSIFLTTTSTQGPATELYKKHGWIEEGGTEVHLGFGVEIHIVFMRLRLGD